MLRARHLSYALILLALASTAVAATARAEGYAGLKPLGVRVTAEPVVSPKKGELYTTSIVWKVREIYVDSHGVEVEVWLYDGKLVENVVRSVKAKFVPEHMQVARLFESRKGALRAFRYWSKFNDPRVVFRELPADTTKPLPGEPDKAPEPERQKTCREAMLEMGHSASHVGYCTDHIPDWCAVTLLSVGHPASWVGYCRGNLDRGCTELMLKRGDSPSRLASTCGK